MRTPTQTPAADATAALKALAVRLRQAFEGSDPPQAGEVACILIESMEPGDLEVARRAHAAIQNEANFELMVCGYIEEASYELLSALKEYIEGSRRWVFENSSWRSLDGAPAAADADPRKEERSDRIDAKIETIKALMTTPGEKGRDSFLRQELSSAPVDGLPFPETAMAVLCYHLKPGDDQVARLAHELGMKAAETMLTEYGRVPAEIPAALELLHDLLVDYGYKFDEGTWEAPDHA